MSTSASSLNSNREAAWRSLTSSATAAFRLRSRAMRSSFVLSGSAPETDCLTRSNAVRSQSKFTATRRIKTSPKKRQLASKSSVGQMSCREVGLTEFGRNGFGDVCVASKLTGSRCLPGRSLRGFSPFSALAWSAGGQPPGGEICHQAGNPALAFLTCRQFYNSRNTQGYSTSVKLDQHA